tara:strand:- start:1558 stop:1962 length:405 start_codon:yes stop_codon:yes gene_type:complete
MKSKFKIHKVILVILLTPVSLFLSYGLITGTTLNLTDELIWSIIFGLIFFTAIYFVWFSFLTQLVKINILMDKITFDNIITKKHFEVLKREIDNIHFSRWTGSMSIKTRNKKITFHPDYYKNGTDLMEKIKTDG